MTGALTILRLHHVALPFPGTTAATADARRFYGEVLGLRDLQVPASLSDLVLWFAAGDQEVHLYAEPSGVAVNAESTRHPCFEVDDLAAVRDHLARLGIEMVDGVPEIPGRPRFYVRDPFDNALEFVEISSST